MEQLLCAKPQERREHRSTGPQLGLSGAENEESLVYGGGGIGSFELGLEG